MKQQKLKDGYISPQMELIDIMPISVLCQSDKVSLEDMTENDDYNFKF